MRLNESGVDMSDKIILNANHKTGKEDLIVRMKWESYKNVAMPL